MKFGGPPKGGGPDPQDPPLDPPLVSECWMFYAVPTARVIFIVKTSLDVFSLRREQVWTFSVLGD